jgi:hypothetical protein
MFLSFKGHSFVNPIVYCFMSENFRVSQFLINNTLFKIIDFYF